MVANDGYSYKGKKNIEFKWKLECSPCHISVAWHIHIWSLWPLTIKRRYSLKVVAFFNAMLEPKVQHLGTKDEYASKTTFRHETKQFRLHHSHDSLKLHVATKNLTTLCITSF